MAMKCPYCGYQDSKVVDSRPAEDGGSIRRRRECLGCGKRFTTYETVETLPLIVVKKDGSRQGFDRNKILKGLIHACDQRRVGMETMMAITDQVEQEAQNSISREISTQRIGEMVMERLKKVDEVSYVRFASVYREFKDMDSFMDELRRMMDEKMN